LALDAFGIDPWPKRRHAVLRSIHTSIVRRRIEQCSQKRTSNKFHDSTFSANKDATGHTVKCANK